MVNNSSNSTSVREILYFIHHRKIGFEFRLHPVLPVPDLTNKILDLTAILDKSAMLLVTQNCYCEIVHFSLTADSDLLNSDSTLSQICYPLRATAMHGNISISKIQTLN